LAATQPLAPYGDGHRNPIPRPSRAYSAGIATKIDRHVPVAYSRFIGEDEMAAEQHLAPYGDGRRSPIPRLSRAQLSGHRHGIHGPRPLRPPHLSAVRKVHAPTSGCRTEVAKRGEDRRLKWTSRLRLASTVVVPLPPNNNVYRGDDNGDAALPCLRQHGLRR